MCISLSCTFCCSFLFVCFVLAEVVSVLVLILDISNIFWYLVVGSGVGYWYISTHF